MTILRRFSLKTVFVAVTVAAMCFAWFATTLRKGQLQQQIVSELQTRHGIVIYDWEYEAVLKQENVEGPDSFLRRMLGDDFFDEVVAVTLFGVEFTDNDLGRLAQFEKLRRLQIENTLITKAALMKYLLDNRSLEAIGLRHQRELTQEDLEQLRIARPNLTIKQSSTKLWDSRLE